MKCTRCGLEIMEEGLSINGDPIFTIGRQKFCSAECKESQMEKMQKNRVEKMKAKKAEPESIPEMSDGGMPESLSIETYMGLDFRYRVDRAKSFVVMTDRASGIDCKIPIDGFKSTIRELQYIATTV